MDNRKGNFSFKTLTSNGYVISGHHIAFLTIRLACSTIHLGPRKRFVVNFIRISAVWTELEAPRIHSNNFIVLRFVYKAKFEYIESIFFLALLRGTFFKTSCIFESSLHGKDQFD